MYIYIYTYIYTNAQRILPDPYLFTIRLVRKGLELFVDHVPRLIYGFNSLD